MLVIFAHFLVGGAPILGYGIPPQEADSVQKYPNLKSCLGQNIYHVFPFYPDVPNKEKIV